MNFKVNFENIFDIAPEGLTIIKDGKIIDTNPASVRFIRANNKEELIGKDIIEFIHPDSLEFALNSLNTLLKNGGNLSKVIIKINCFDGVARRFEFSGLILESSNEEFILLISKEVENYLLEIEDLKNKGEKLNAIFNAFPDLMFVINNKNIITDYFAPSDLLLYAKPENFLDKSIYASLPDYLAKLTDEKVKKVLETGVKEEYEYSLNIENKIKYFNCSLVKKSKNEVLATIRDISSKKEIELALEEELKFNSIINELAIKFINFRPNEVDEIINQGLAQVGNYFGVDRVYIFEFDFANRTMSNTYEWCAENVSSEIENLQNMDIDILPGFVELMLNKKIFRIDDVKKYEDEIVRSILEPQGILSIIIHPIFIDNECFGYVGFDSVKTYKKFSDKEVNFLRILSNFLGNIFQKIRTEKQINEKNKQIEATRLATLNIIEDLQSEVNFRKEAEKELKLSEQKFRSYIEQTKGIIFVIQRDGRFSYLSPSVKDIIGEDPENLIGKPYLANVHKEDVYKFSSQLKELIRTLRSIKSVPIRFKHKNGHYIWIVVQAGPILDDKGEIKEIIGVAVDINELIETRQKLSLTESRYKSLFENQIEAFALHEIILDDNGIPCDYRFIDVNKSFLDITNLSNKNQVVGKTVLEIWPDIEREWIQIFGTIALSGGRETFEKFSSVFNKTFLVNVYSEEYLKFAVSFYDISDRKKSEIIRKIQLNIANATIYLSDLSELLLKIRDELSQVIDTKNFFVAAYNENQKQFKTLLNIDEKQTDSLDISWDEESSLSGLVMKNKTPMLLSKKEIDEFDKRHNIKTSEVNPEIWLGVPILSKRKSIGVIVVQSYHNPNAYDQSTIDLLQTISNQLAIYIEQQEFESQIRLLSKAIEQSSALVVITDKNNNIQFVNNKFLQNTKFTLEEVIGKNPNILKSNFHKDVFYKEMWRALSAGNEWSGEILNKDKFGNKFWVSAIISPVLNSEGKITNYVSIQEDITERKKLQEKVSASEKQLRTTWEYSVDGMRLCDENGLIVQVNQALCKMYGVEQQDFIGKPFYYMIKNYSGGGLKKFHESIKSGNIEKVKEYSLQLENGKFIDIEVTNSIINFDDGKKYLFTVFRDISEKKRMINDLIAARDKAEEMNRIKSQFFANMSHELRTPFMGILGFTELLKSKVNDEEGIFFLDGISRSSNRMVETLTNILDITKIEAGKSDTKKEFIETEFIILDTFEHFKYQAAKKNLSFEKIINLPEHFKLLINEKMFRSILNNLISNAIKFTNEGKVTISSYIKDLQFFIEVEDTGIGIPKEKQEIIFDEFRQVSEGHSRAFEGTGLGLSIVKKFTELMGGRVEVESELNVGSKFKIIFPL